MSEWQYTPALTQRIEDVTADHLGDIATELDLAAFKAACRNYQAAADCTEDEAIDAIWNDGDFLDLVYAWAPVEAKAAEEESK